MCQRCPGTGPAKMTSRHPEGVERSRRVVIFAETERGRRRDEEPYSCTVTIPDGSIAKGSAKSTTLLRTFDGDDALHLLQRLHHVLELLKVLANEREQVDGSAVVTRAAVCLADV